MFQNYQSLYLIDFYREPETLTGPEHLYLMPSMSSKVVLERFQNMRLYICIAETGDYTPKVGEVQLCLIFL